MPGDRRVHGGGDGHRIPHIARHSAGDQGGLAPVHNDDLGPLSDEPLRDRLPDSSRTACDQRHPAGETARGHQARLAIF